MFGTLGGWWPTFRAEMDTHATWLRARGRGGQHSAERAEERVGATRSEAE